MLKAIRIHKRLVFLTILILGTGWVATSSESQAEPFIPHVETSNVVVDGVIGSEEYIGVYKETKTGMIVYWEHDGTNMYLGLTSPGMGWTSIAFGPQGTGMDGANIIIGYVDDIDTAALADSIGEGWAHERDTTRGGQDNVLEQAGTQSTEGTILEFIFPLKSGDVNDHNFEMGGTYGFFVAYHESSDDFTSYHATRSEILSLRIGKPGELPQVGTETMLALSVPLEQVEQLDSFTISARLTDIEGIPLEGETIRFYLVTTFVPNDLQIGEAITNGDGTAQLEYSHSKPGVITIKAAFEGTPEFEASKDTDMVFVMSVDSEEESPDVLRIPGTDAEVSIDALLLALILVFVFGSVYVTYARVIYSLLIQVPKEKATEEIRPRELRFEDVE